VFNGSRFRSEIVPRISDFVLSNNAGNARNGKRAGKGKLGLVATGSSAARTPQTAQIRAANE
jgi:hypothetical protein